MDKQNIRLIFIGAICVIAFLLYNSWQTDNNQKKLLQQANTVLENNSLTNRTSDIPSTITSAPIVKKEIDIDPNRIINISTDVLNAKIDLLGGDIIYLDLPKYPESLDEQNKGFVLLDESKDRFYVIQSGLLNESGPDSNSLGRQLYNTPLRSNVMRENEDVLTVDMNFTTRDGVEIVKRFIFVRGSYEVNINYIVDNHSTAIYTASPFGRIKRSVPAAVSSGLFGATKTYTGAAINTPATKYKKISFSDMQKKPFSEKVVGGWAAMVEHYFVSALIPSPLEQNYYKTESFSEDVFGITFVTAAKDIAAGAKDVIETKLYVGPEIAQQLKSLAPGLELTIDYGFLWFLCQPIFWLLKTMYEVFRNWGVAIIATTVLIKALFYKLSASSYKSMGNMRKLQPKIEALKKRYGDDKQQFSQAMMDLYRKDKVNPLGGCLPILIQIPVFISLYYVLLESVELRQAPFMLWIHDLSAKDPYYVLPILMGISMFIQQRLNPAPPDPLQAKVLMFMPIFFTFLFFQFPAGLVLYWVVNNILSILQQWYITRNIEKAGK